MKNNRRGFIKKGAAAAAAMSLAGLGSCTNDVRTRKSRPFVRDASGEFIIHSSSTSMRYMVKPWCI
ncbi:MAG: twin-arginine translocation signal domain-containing protein [Bacteroidales bacterium]|nr:twin-arginine translocation signal domain-containing protein [Bacteroidales bacterium]